MSLFEKKISTERLTLDAITDKDFESLIAILKDDTVSKTYMVPSLKTPEDEKRIFSALSDLSRRSDRYVYGIFLREKLIGIVNDTEIEGKVIELGYAISPEFFGKGYMTEALKGLIKHLFFRGFKQILCGAFEDNAASIRVMQKCGMRKIRKTEDLVYRNEKHLCVFYSVKSHSFK